MTAAIFEKTWTVRASAAKAAQRAGLAKGSYIIAECNGEFAILELEADQGEKLDLAAIAAEDQENCDKAADNERKNWFNYEPPHGKIEDKNEVIVKVEPGSPMAKLIDLLAPRSENATSLPTPPDFSKPSHAPYRKRLAAMIAMAEAGDFNGLAILTFKVERSSQKIMARYRDACLKALGA